MAKFNAIDGGNVKLMAAGMKALTARGNWRGDDGVALLHTVLNLMIRVKRTGKKCVLRLKVMAKREKKKKRDHLTGDSG